MCFVNPHLHSCHHWHKTTRNYEPQQTQEYLTGTVARPIDFQTLRAMEEWSFKGLPGMKRQQRVSQWSSHAKMSRQWNVFIVWVVNIWCCNWSENVTCKLCGFGLHSTYSFSRNQTHDLSVASTMLDIQLDKTSYSGCVFLKTVQTSWKVVNCICQDSCKVCTSEPRLHLTYSRFLLSMIL